MMFENDNAMLDLGSPGLQALLDSLGNSAPPASPASELPLVPDLSHQLAPAAGGAGVLDFGSFDDVLADLDIAAKTEPVMPPTPPPTVLKPKAKAARHSRRVTKPGALRGAELCGGPDALERLFPKAVLQLEPAAYAEIKKERYHLLSAEQQRKLTAARRRARNCVYAEDKRQRRIADKRNADTLNAELTKANEALRAENARLRLELAAAGATANAGPQ